MQNILQAGFISSFTKQKSNRFGATLYFRFEVLSQIDTTFLQTPKCGFVWLLFAVYGLTQQFSFIKRNIFQTGFAANIISQNQTAFGWAHYFLFCKQLYECTASNKKFGKMRGRRKNNRLQNINQLQSGLDVNN